MNIQFACGELETYLAFLDEARDHLESMEERILDLAELCDAERVNVIFRGLHSIKGVASFLNLTDIQKLSHQLESVFDAVRQERIPVSEDMVHTCLSGLDILVGMVKNLEAALQGRKNVPNRRFEIELPSEDYSEAYAMMQKMLGTEEAITGPVVSAPEEDFITEEMRAAFKREAEELLDSTEQMLMELEAKPNDLDLLKNSFRSIHSYKGNCGYFGLAENERLAHMVETLLEGLRNGHRIEALPEIVAFALKSVDAFRVVHQRMAECGDAHLDALEIRLEEAERLLRAGQVDTQDEGQAETVGTSPNTVQTTSQSKVEVRREEMRRDLRVDLTKLDHLLDLVGELVIASGMVINHPKLKSANIPELEKVFHQLQGVVADLQQMALGVRMVPVEGVFKKMTRLVHDLSAKCGKKVKLELFGEKTEIDKNLADLIADPLVHMIRNSIDHGMEPPVERQESGKPEIGTITLAAEQDGGEIVVTIRDDGRGMNRDRILAKALEKGLTDASASELPDEEIFKFIFLPGFSTAESVTSTSGRGVGMDVVKSNVEKMNGRIHIRSQRHQGTQISLRIPLTLSIIEGMQVRVGHSLFILPLLAVQESIAPRSNQIVRIMGEGEALLIRGHTVPIVRLHALHSLAVAEKKIENGILLRVEFQGAHFCLLVDEIMGQRQTVVKALPAFLGKVPGVTACSILDDGAISLILDPVELWALQTGAEQVKPVSDKV
jgi:two-component system, chemotaxis family, sensor kinase CheA